MFNMDETSFSKKVEKSLKSEAIVLFVIPSAEYHEKSIQLINYLTEKDLYGVYITVNKPSATIKNEFKEYGVDFSKIFFIDGISKQIGFDVDEDEGTMFLKSPHNLTDISIVISEAMKSIKSNEKFLFLDSLSTLALYNDPNAVSRFIHHVSNKLRKDNISGIFLSVEKEIDEKILSSLSQFCDKTINI